MPNTKNPALFLLAMLKNENATVRLGAGRLEIGPPELAKKLMPKIREHKANLVRFLLDQDCPVCGLELASDWSGVSEAGPRAKNATLRRLCRENHYSTSREIPDFPV